VVVVVVVVIGGGGGGEMVENLPTTWNSRKDRRSGSELLP